MTVIIGVDPHKASHTAVAIDDREGELDRTRVRATRKQTLQLLEWAEPLGTRTWAIESAGGLGYLLAQQLVDAGETVVDVPATLVSRVRVLATGRSDKTDPNDALSVAIAALRAPALREVRAADHAEILRLLAKRNIDIGKQRTRVVCRLHNLSMDSPRAESPKNSTLLTPFGSSSGSSPRRPSNRRATTWPPSCSPTCSASTPNSRNRTVGSALLCGPQARPSPTSSASDPSSRAI